MKEIEINKMVCACGANLNAAVDSEISGIKPKEGDWSICLYCGELYIFTDTLELRLAKVEENIEFSKSSSAKQVIKIRNLYAKIRNN